MMNYFVLSILLGFVLLDVVVSISQSKSCTMIDGKWKCEEMTDPSGTSAGSVSMAQSGPYEPKEFRRVGTGSHGQHKYHTARSGFEEPEEYQPEESQPAGYDSHSDMFQPIVPVMPYMPFGPYAASSAFAGPAGFGADQASPAQTYEDQASPAQTYGDQASPAQTYGDHASQTGHHYSPDDSSEVTVTSTSGQGSMPGFFPMVAVPLAFGGPEGAFAGAGSYAGAGGAYAGPGGAYAGPGFAGFGFPPYSAYSIFRRRR